MSGQHTPGPWKRVDALSARAVVPSEWLRGAVRGPNQEMVCYVGDLGERAQPFDSEANAELIAAAPELLAELEWLVRYLTEPDFQRDESIAAYRPNGGNVGALEARLQRASDVIRKSLGLGKVAVGTA